MEASQKERRTALAHNEINLYKPLDVLDTKVFVFFCFFLQLYKAWGFFGSGINSISQLYKKSVLCLRNCNKIVFFLYYIELNVLLSRV